MEVGTQVDGQRAVPLLVGYVLARFVGGLEGRVADQHVDPAELLHGPVDDLAAVRRVGQVAGHQHRLTAGLLDPLGRLPRVFILVQVADQHVGAFAGECDRHRAADSAVGAGDDGLLALEPAAAAGNRLLLRRLVPCFSPFRLRSAWRATPGPAAHTGIGALWSRWSAGRDNAIVTSEQQATEQQGAHRDALWRPGAGARCGGSSAAPRSAPSWPPRPGPGRTGPPTLTGPALTSTVPAGTGPRSPGPRPGTGPGNWPPGWSRGDCSGGSGWR